jgi:hypothetical protein
MHEAYAVRFALNIQRDPSNYLRDVFTTLEINQAEARHQALGEPVIFGKDMDGFGIVRSYRINPRYRGRVRSPVETPTAYAEGGFKGAGEAGVAGAPGAVLNAVNDALAPFNARVTRQPITPEVVLKALGRIERSGPTLGSVRLEAAGAPASLRGGEPPRKSFYPS